MALAATFLAGAKSRLLPASIPFRFFGAAVIFHGLAWLALLVGGEQATGFAGGLGWPLAALHALTLGVLVMTALGASLQLLPVATRQPVVSQRAPALLWWLFTPGVALLLASMAWAWPTGLALGAAAVVLALAGYALLLARNLHGARGMPVVVVHGWAALASLAVLLVSGLSLAAGYHGHGGLERAQALGLHVSFAAYGFMGMLALGFSYILVPMFALAEAPPQRTSMTSAALALGGLCVAGLASLGAAPALTWPLAIVSALAALALHVLLMQRALSSGMRRQLGRSFVLVRIGWIGLAGSLLLALAIALGASAPRLPTLFGVLLIGGLLSFLLGMLSRIVPFLASMHAPAGRRGPPMPSSLTAERPLALHFGCHLAALALLLLAVLVDNAWLARAAGGVGVVGALAFGRFFLFAWRRMDGGAKKQAPASAGSTQG